MDTNEIREYWASNHKKTEYGSGSIHAQCPRIECADGFVMSVQASSYHYCSPRTYIESGDYGAWEIGFPNEREDLIMPYVEDNDRPTDTVYGYVPTIIINEVIRKHGGIKLAAAVA